MNDEGPRLVHTNGGLSVAWGQRWLYSRYAPAQSAVRLAEAAELQEATLYFIPSPCLGYGLETLLSRLPESSALLCVELDRGLNALCGQALEPFRAKARAFDRIALVEEADGEPSLLATVDAARRLGRFRRVVKLRLSQGEDLHAGAYQRLVTAIEEDLSTFWRNKIALVRMARLWTKNFFFNLGALEWSRALDAPPIESKAVVVCGAGTSLDQAIGFLRDSGPDLHIMACDTAAGALAKAGVRVDSLVCLEGQVYNIADFLPIEHETPLSFIDLSAHPSSYRAVDGPYRILVSRWMESTLHDRFAACGLPCLSVDPLGSVGVLALNIARRLFSGPIFVAGLDFCFPQGRTHCSGSPQDIAERARETRLYRGENAWRASFRVGAERIEQGYISDPALKMYASLASRELSLLGQDRKAYDLRQGMGAVLPAQAVDFTQAKALLEAEAHRPSSQRQGEIAGASSRATSQRNREKARAFLEGELRLAARLREALKDGSEPSRLADLVKACDYMYAHFPDPERVQALELDALKRLVAEASYWEARIRAALS